MNDRNRSNLVISVRNIVSHGSKFGSEPGRSSFLEVPDGEVPNPKDHKIDKRKFVDEVMNRAKNGDIERKTGPNRRENFATGDVLVFIHGYNNSLETVMTRHNLLQQNLAEFDYKGAIVSFDWPCDNSVLNYLEDRRDAKQTAFRLVDDGIKLIAQLQRDQRKRKCEIDVHLLGHSTGAYVIREGFADANQNRSISRINWIVSQVALIGADVSARSLASNSDKSHSLFQHAIRITNYSSKFDRVLKLSNLKRFGTSPRVGRVGLPDNAHPNCVNVDCSQYWENLNQNDISSLGDESHSWHFNDKRFAEDLVYTISGDIDRNRIPTRTLVEGELILN